MVGKRKDAGDDWVDERKERRWDEVKSGVDPEPISHLAPPRNPRHPLTLHHVHTIGAPDRRRIEEDEYFDDNVMLVCQIITQKGNEPGTFEDSCTVVCGTCAAAEREIHEVANGGGLALSLTRTYTVEDVANKSRQKIERKVVDLLMASRWSPPGTHDDAREGIESFVHGRIQVTWLEDFKASPDGQLLMSHDAEAVYMLASIRAGEESRSQNTG